MDMGRAAPPVRLGPETPTSEAALLARARTGDEEAFRTLVDLHRDRAFSLALRVVRSRSDAEEVAQDAFVRAWRGLARYRGEARFSTWLHRIVVRRALDRAATLKRRAGRETIEEAAESVSAADHRDDAERAALGRRLASLMDRLTPAQRAAVALFYYEDRSVDEVARALAMPENTVKTHLSRARAALRAAWLAETGTA
jgi:RNA polymerase sigma-70 factor (ECF subfamily)